MARPSVLEVEAGTLFAGRHHEVSDPFVHAGPTSPVSAAVVLGSMVGVALGAVLALVEVV